MPTSYSAHGFWSTLAAEKNKASFYLVLLSVASLMGLAVWQCMRAQEKIQSYQSRMQTPALALKNISADKIQKLGFRQAIISLNFDGQHCLLLNRQIYHHYQGYRMLCLASIPHHHHRLLVDMGWIPKTPNPQMLKQSTYTQHLPRPNFPLGQHQLKGWFYQPFSPSWMPPATTIMQHHWPKLIDNISFDMLSHYLKDPLIPWIFHLSPKQPLGFLIDQPLTPGSHWRHIGYALQFFILAIIALFIYSKWLTQRREYHAKN